MKKNVTLRAALLAALALGFIISCNKDINPEEVSPSIIRANIPEEITKVSLTDTGVDNGMSLAWQANDKIRVIATAGGSASEVFTIKDGFTANNAQFEGTPVTGSEFTVFYPGTYADVAAINAHSYASQTQIGNGSTAHLEWNAIESGLDQYGSVNFTGKQNGAIRFKLQLPAAFTKVYKVALNVPSAIFSTTNAEDATTDELVLNLKADASTNGITLGADRILTAYIMVSWNDNVIPANTDVTIKVWGDQDDPWVKVKHVANDFPIVGGKVTNIQLNNSNWEEPISGNYFAIVQSDVTASTSYDSGAERTWNYGENAQFGAVNVLNSDGNISFRGSNRGKLYNKSEFGRITEIQVILDEGSVTEQLTLYVGSSAQPVTNPITPVKNGTTCTYTVPDDIPASYFMLQSTVTTNVSKIIVKYDVSPWIMAVTGDADDLLTDEGTTATLHGSYTAGNIASTAGIVCGFEIKDNPSGVTISSVTVSTDGSFSATASGLTPGTNYEYRAVVTYESITGNGEYKTFSTTKKTSSIKTITITPSSIDGLNTSYGDYTWTQEGMELTINKILQNAGEERFKGKKAEFQFFNTTSIGKIKSVAVLTDGYGTNTLTVCGGTTSKGTDVYSAAHAPTEDVISVEFASPCDYFWLKSPNQNIYIKTITITVDTSGE